MISSIWKSFPNHFGECLGVLCAMNIDLEIRGKRERGLSLINTQTVEFVRR